jgi:hypothetical protein
MEHSRRTEEAREFGFETRQVHAGQRPDPNTGARAVPARFSPLNAGAAEPLGRN